MKYTYEVMLDPYTDEETDTIRRSDGAVIPKDAGNSDYQSYLHWLENLNAEKGETL